MPTNVRAQVLNESTANVSWTPPSQEVDSYTIEAQSLVSSKSRRKRQALGEKLTTTVAGTASSGIIGNLQPFTRYAFGVFATVNFLKTITNGVSSLPRDTAGLDGIAIRTNESGQYYHKVFFFPSHIFVA